jgi:hypothetical protein
MAFRVVCSHKGGILPDTETIGQLAFQINGRTPFIVVMVSHHDVSSAQLLSAIVNQGTDQSGTDINRSAIAQCGSVRGPSRDSSTHSSKHSVYTSRCKHVSGGSSSESFPMCVDIDDIIAQSQDQAQLNLNAINLNVLLIGRPIGKGAFGDVYLGAYCGRRVAIKMVPDSASAG